jgi:diacylglycerol O-acyltransferase
MAASASMKATLGSVKSLLPTDFPSMGVPWLMEGLTAIYGRAGVADRIPPVANVVISNVPGPTVPLYMAGAKMLTNYPTSIVVHGVALNITVQTYNESLDVGIIACAQAMPEVDEFAAHVETSFLEFKALPVAPEAVAAPPVPKVAAKKVAGKKAVVKKAAARKAPAKKAPAKKAAAKKAPVRKPAAKKAAKPVPKVTRKARASAPTAKRPSR